MAGRVAEEHTVTTEDGYLLLLTRIPGPGTPLLMVHGFIEASHYWVIRGASSLAFMLNDMGYDVWLPDLRGNAYSHSHKTLPSNSRQFWDFSIDEIGTYDTAAIIDYVLQQRKQNSLQYICHSMGCAVLYILTSTKPEYNRKVDLAINFAPAVFGGSLGTQPHRFLIQTSLVFNSFIRFNEFYPRVIWYGNVLGFICRKGSPLMQFCLRQLSLTFGYGHRTSHHQVDLDMLPLLVSHVLTGTSTKVFEHIGQLMLSGRFCKYDYGGQGNLAKYGSIQPPDYPLSKVTIPVAIYYADADILVNPKDVKKLAENLGNVIGVFKVQEKTFNHIDFLWGTTSKSLVYDRVIELLTQYNR